MLQTLSFRFRSPFPSGSVLELSKQLMMDRRFKDKLRTWSFSISISKNASTIFIVCLCLEMTMEALELGEFLDGIFSPGDPSDGIIDEGQGSASVLDPNIIPVRLEPELEPESESESQGNYSTTQIDDGGEELILVSQSDTTPQDILCLRGNGGIHNAANMVFRQVVSTNKSHFDSLPYHAKPAFAASLWIQLRDNGHRFLRPAAGGQYEVLDYAKSVHKIRQALLSCRVSCSKPVADDAECDLPMEEKIFDDVARASIRQILARQEFVEAIRRHWGEDTVAKAQQFEEHVSS